MSVVGKIVRGRASTVRCDGCGRISRDSHGYYLDRKLNKGGNISGHGRECRHDFCDECESKNEPAPACPKCAAEKVAP